MSLLRAAFYEAYAEQQACLNTAKKRPVQSLLNSCWVRIFFWAGTESPTGTMWPPKVAQSLKASIHPTPSPDPTLAFLEKSFRFCADLGKVSATGG